MAEQFPKLVVLTGPEEGQTYNLPANGTIAIGRSDENQFQLEDSSVSRRHATILAREGKYFLKDEKSRNGTILEGQKLADDEEVSLSHLDEFRLGIYDLRFVERPYTEADIKLKKQQAKDTRQSEPVPPSALEKSITKKDVEKSSPKIPASPPASNAAGTAEGQRIEAESLIDDLLAEKEKVEENLPSARRSRLRPVLLFLLLILTVGFAAYVYRDHIPGWMAKIRGDAPRSARTATDNDVAGKDRKRTKVAPQPNAVTVASSGTAKGGSDPTAVPVATNPQGAPTTIPPTNLAVPSTTTAPATTAPDPDVDTTAPVTVITPTTTPAAQTFSVFLDVKTKPFPADIYFENQRLGTAPIKANVTVEPDKTYAVYADYDLRDIGDIYRKKVEFKARPDADVIEMNLSADIGTMKILKLPPRVEFYLEGYYDYDKDKANPVKLTDIVYGKPIYLPYGKYTVELKENLSVAGSSNLIKQTRFQREYVLNAETPSLELSILEKDLKVFPAVIKSDPTGADVYLNGEKVGITPYQGSLPIGKNQVRVVKDGFFEKNIDIEMNMNSVYETVVTLETSKVGELLNKAKEHIRIERRQDAIDTLVEALKYGGSAKEKAEVYFLLGQGYAEQKLYEQAKPYYEKARAHPDFAIRATLGLATVAADQKDGTQALKYVVEVLANMTPDTPAGLRAEANAVFKKVSQFKSVIYIHTEPEGASVFVNDRKINQPSPVILSDLSLGTYRIEVEKPGYEIYKTKQTLKVGEFVLVRVKLTKQTL